ncbi:MAG: carbohydrate binding domain-containing protein [Bacteroidota bacterium]
MKRIMISLALIVSISVAQSQTITVDVSKTKGEIQPTMWGIFFEDINFAADGGLYAELVKNRSFEFLAPMMGWKEVASNKFSLNTKSGAVQIINKDSRYARVVVNGSEFQIENEGFFGMGVKKDAGYIFSVMMKSEEGQVSLKAELIDDKNNVIGTGTISPDSKDWKKYSTNIVSTATFAKAKLRLSFAGQSITDVDNVSLVPKDTWHGLRKDLVQLLYDLKPGFVRFPADVSSRAVICRNDTSGRKQSVRWMIAS